MVGKTKLVAPKPGPCGEHDDRRGIDHPQSHCVESSLVGRMLLPCRSQTQTVHPALGRQSSFRPASKSRHRQLRMALPKKKWSSIRVARPVFRFGRPACISQHPCSQNSVPCWNRTSLCGFANRRLSCSANGMCSDFDDKGWVEARVRFSWITARVCHDTSTAECEIDTIVNVTVNP
jgi:hypothetical protein